jgi:hypothetical protein
MRSACRQLELPNSSLSNSTSHQAAGSKTTSTAPLTTDHLTIKALPGGLFEVFLSNGSSMANNTVTVEAATVGASDTDTTQAQTDMRECLEGMADAGVIANNALELLRKLYKASGDSRHTIIGNADKATQQLAGSFAQMQYAIKQDPKGTVASALPSLALETHLDVIDKVDRTVVLEIARELARHSLRAMDEDLSSYGDAGCFYAGAPLGVDFGLEVGIRTGEGADTQRSGLVVGLRLDHLTGAKPARTLAFPKASC